MFYKTLVLVLMLFQLPLYSQKRVPSQFELVKKNAFRLSYDIPLHFFNQTKYVSYFDDFHFFEMLYLSKEANPFKVFWGSRDSLTPSQARHPSILNSTSQFKDVVKLDFGVCSGVTFFMRKFHQLAYFDPQNKMRQRVPDYKLNRQAWLKFFKSKVIDVMSLKPAVFPYFKSFNHFSASKDLNIFLKEIILAEWVKKNVSLAGLLQYLKTRQKRMSYKDIKNLYDSLIFRLSVGYKPIVYLYQYNDKIYNKNAWIHVLNVFKVERNQDDSYSIYMWDVNTKFKNSTRKVIVHPDGSFTGSYQNLAGIYLYPLDELEIADTIKNKLSWCNQNKIHQTFCLKGKI